MKAIKPIQYTIEAGGAFTVQDTIIKNGMVISIAGIHLGDLGLWSRLVLACKVLCGHRPMFAQPVKISVLNCEITPNRLCNVVAVKTNKRLIEVI